MKFTPFVSAIILSLPFSNSLAADYICQPLKGTLGQLQQDSACKVYDAQEDIFPDLKFLSPESTAPLPFLIPPYCYAGTLKGTLGGVPISGAFKSALTENNFDPLEALTAASVITINADFRPKLSGDINTTDTIQNPVGATTERLTVIAGSKFFTGIRGNIYILGNTMVGPANFTGTLCRSKQ
jgi:hypothetical protein